MILPVEKCDVISELHDHIECERARFLAEHDHEACQRILVSLRPSRRFCHIPDDQTHGKATHARWMLDNQVPYCDPCFVDVFGPHDCRNLGCSREPCGDAGKLLDDEALESPDE